MQADVCENLEQVRQQIDIINSALLALLAKRQQYVERAAQLKTDISQVPAPNHRAQIIGKITKEALQLGLDPDLATKIFNTMIDAFITFEQKKHQEVH